MWICNKLDRDEKVVWVPSWKILCNVLGNDAGVLFGEGEGGRRLYLGNFFKFCCWKFFVGDFI